MLDSLSKYLGPIKKVMLVLNKHRLITYMVFIFALYSLVIVKINNLGQVLPSTTQTQTTSTVATPEHINQSVISQLQQLQNNNVTVQALFEQARSNPF